MLDRILDAWMAEAVRALDGLGGLEEWPHQWFWDGREHVDPAKEANAQDTHLKNHTTTLAAEYAKVGKDWEAELRQRAKEKALMDELGLSMEQTATGTQPSAKDDDDEEARSTNAGNR